jgi:protein subunit release factor A
MEKIYLELRSAEGGEDSKLLVDEMKNIYVKAARLNNFACEIIDERSGMTCLCL